MYINDNNDVLKIVNKFYEKTNNNEYFILLKHLKIMYQEKKQQEHTKLKCLKESQVRNLLMIKNKGKR